MIWSDRDIEAAVAAGRLGIEPWLPADLTPNGIDLRIGHVLVPGASPEPATQGTVRVPALARFVVGTSTVVALPDDAVGSLWLRSSYARRGVLASFGKVDAGFHGNLTLAAFNASAQELEVPVGDRFCQLVLERLTGPAAKPYAARSGNYQGQRGVTLARDAP